MQKKTGLFAPNILLANDNIDMEKWATIACDQFTSEKEYWDTLSAFVSGSKSTLNLVLPEIYLNGDYSKKIDNINSAMTEYLETGVFKELPKGFILTVRSTPYVDKRIGLVGAIDLEEYEYSKKSSALIRSTEGTIEERIPPRLKIREKAAIELTHIMVLYDDETRSINERLYADRDKYQKVYDSPLNMDGGHIEGYFIKDYAEIIEKFSALLNEEKLKSKYGETTPFLFAVGDGNHSLATAKAHWNKVKERITEEERKTHPARYALCEIVNVYDDGIYFEPIHRLVKGVDREDFVKGLTAVSGNYKVYNGEALSPNISADSLPKSIENIDKFIKDYILSRGGEVDYVHGDENVKKVVDNDKNAVAILFDKIGKDILFKYVASVGALPRKTFSMGEGKEKRYYLEAKRI